MNPNLERQLAKLQRGSHLCLLYSDTAEQLETALPFIRNGLRNHERCMYIADDRSVDEITCGFEALGVDTSAELGLGSLTLETKRETYLKSGVFEPGLMIEMLRRATEQSLADGYVGFRVTGEMTWALGPGAGTDLLIEYEARLNDFLPNGPWLAVCQYNLARFPPKLIEQVLRTHPIAIIGGEIYANLYYEPPAQVLGPSTAAQRTSWMIGQLERTRQLEREHERLEAQLRESQKLEAVGQLAGGVAHDFNNLLSVIMSVATLAKENLPAEDPTVADLDDILHAASSAADLTRQLLAFSRRQVQRRRTVNLNDLVTEVARMLRRLLPEDIELLTVTAADLWLTEIDPSHFEQLFVNLTINARDAMPTGGRLTIETANVMLDSEYARTHSDAAPGPHVMLAVSDTGTGMTAEVRERIFEPFFTTKDRGKGTGLGLATCYGIVRQAGGNIWVYSEPGQGTTFKIYLTLTTREMDVHPHPAADPAPARPTETILIVEDDDAVRSVAVRVLRQIGYTVLDAAGPQEALRISGSHPGPIHLLLTDVVMPGIGGKALGAMILRDRPSAALLFMSGYTDNSIVHHGVLEPGVAFLQKPLVPSSLRSRVREVLDAHGLAARPDGEPDHR